MIEDKRQLRHLGIQLSDIYNRAQKHPFNEVRFSDNDMLSLRTVIVELMERGDKDDIS